MSTRYLLAEAAVLAAGLLALAAASRDACAAEGQDPKISFGIHKVTEDNVEGPNVERTYFTVGEKRIAFGLPKGWRITVNDGFLLLPEERGIDGEIHVTRSTFTPDYDLAANALKYRESASQSAPRGAENEEVQPPVMNPYAYNNWKSLGFTWTYSMNGRAMVRTVSYINLDVGGQVIVTTLAAKQDAEKVDQAAKQFMGSWWAMGK